jgi:hypothetical protein
MNEAQIERTVCACYRRYIASKLTCMYDVAYDLSHCSGIEWLTGNFYLTAVKVEMTMQDRSLLSNPFYYDDGDPLQQWANEVY